MQSIQCYHITGEAFPCWLEKERRSSADGGEKSTYLNAKSSHIAVIIAGRDVGGKIQKATTPFVKAEMCLTQTVLHYKETDLHVLR